MYASGVPLARSNTNSVFSFVSATYARLPCASIAMPNGSPLVLTTCGAKSPGLLDGERAEAEGSATALGVGAGVRVGLGASVVEADGDGSELGAAGAPP